MPGIMAPPEQVNRALKYVADTYGEPEPAGGHEHEHRASCVSYPAGMAAMTGPVVTYVLYRCGCNTPGHVVTKTLRGRWSLAQVLGTELPPGTVTVEDMASGPIGGFRDA